MKGFVWRLVVALSVFTEIVAAQYDVPEANERNVARLGTCSNSSVSRRDNSDRHCSWIINGNKDVTDGSRNCFSTADEVTKPSRLTVILKHRYYIHKVVIYGRSNDLDRMPQIQVFFDGIPVYNVSEKRNVTIWKIPENSRQFAKNVLLHKDNTATYRDISLCEVEIYTCNEGFFGPRCDRPCGAKRCKECNGSCLVNVAPLGTCSNSSMSSHADFAGSTCDLYINGNTTTFFSKQVNCFETGNQKNPESVSVILRHKYAIHSVVLYSRADWQDRMKGIEVHLDGFSVYKVSDANHETIIYVNNLNLREASTVTLVRRNESIMHDRPMINLCELEIYTCGKGFFGPSCDRPCDDKCAECKEKEKCLECYEGFWGTNLCPNKCGQGCESGNCSIANGTCQCRKTQGQHWEPSNCENCSVGYWGDNCSQPCGQGCKGSCNKTNRQCECQPGWQPPKCEGCSKDYWGANCSQECSKTCSGTDQEGYCDNTTGKCLKGCSAGYWGDNCSETCGPGCGNTCNAKDGTCYCRQGWKPPKCEVPSCTCGGAECEADNKYVFSELSRKINVAVGKNSIASTTLKEPKPVSGPACLANNGKTESTMVPIPSSAPECMSTAEGDLKPFWQVDLGEQYVVAGILIEWDNQMKSLFGIRVLLDGKQLYYSEKPMTNPTELAANDLGQVVKLQREKFQDNKEWDDPLLRICEVEVYTCRPGYYGHDCQGICERPVCDNLQICSRIDGSCPKDAPVEELDCSKLIIVAGCFVHVLVVALCILAAKVLPRKKRSGTKPGKHQTDTDQTKSDDENKEDKGDDKGEQSSQGGEEEKEEEAEAVEEAESQM